jgi:hypothetical protein
VKHECAARYHASRIAWSKKKKKTVAASQTEISR